ncbi:MAG: hypothetical protein WC527_01560 [Candidatus Margulisiibacteriota bacterium]
MDKLKIYLDGLKSWHPEADFGAMYLNVIAHPKPDLSYVPSALKFSAAFAALFVVLSAGLYFSSLKGSYDSPLSYVFEQESLSGNGPVGYILSE